jgi:hypothetical protein
VYFVLDMVRNAWANWGGRERRNYSTEAFCGFLGTVAAPESDGASRFGIPRVVHMKNRNTRCIDGECVAEG